MRKFFTSLLLLMAALVSSAQNPALAGFEGRTSPDARAVSYVTPSKVLWIADSLGVSNVENLLQPFCGQTTVANSRVCTFDTRDGHRAGILLDFGKELHGGIKFTTAIRPDGKPARLRVRLGESVTEAMSDVTTTSATNDHALRDYVVELPWLGSIEVGESGFRFAFVELLEEDYELPLCAVEATFKYRDIPYLGSFRSSDARLDSIWQTGAYTVHLNMQNYLWDGVKRDRLVWVGDMHPEVMTISSVFGDNEVVHKSLDLARDDTPLPGWMNGMCSYSLWWILIHHDLYLYQADKEYLREQLPYLQQLIEQIIANTDGSRERLQGATRFLDWPTSENQDVIDSGLQALTVMALDAAAEIAGWLDDTETATKSRAKADELRKYIPDNLHNKQAAALLSLSGLSDPVGNAEVIAENGADGFSTFFGYYMLEALAEAGRYDEALDIIRAYWGGMLDLGATTFWEDLVYSDLPRASRIDGFVPRGKYDIHADGGDYCYKGLRHSLCHGWASGPTAWLSRHILGIEPLEPGFSKVRINPNLGDLEWAEGSMPTPHGLITVSHKRLADGKIKSEIKLPKGVKLVK